MMSNEIQNSVLFVCSANKDRSATAEALMNRVDSNNTHRSAGTNPKICHQLGTHFITEDDLNWADQIYAMETKHKKAIEQLFGTGWPGKIVILHIRDVYDFGEMELEDLLKNKMHLGQKN
jgi:predicted protein tyrosine phosphatase